MLFRSVQDTIVQDEDKNYSVANKMLICQNSFLSVLSILMLMEPYKVDSQTLPCIRENEKCHLKDSNLMDVLYVDVAECRTQCGNTSECKVFTHYGPGSSPYQNVCMLLTSCEDTR